MGPNLRYFLIHFPRESCVNVSDSNTDVGLTTEETQVSVIILKYTKKAFTQTFDLMINLGLKFYLVLFLTKTTKTFNSSNQKM